MSDHADAVPAPAAPQDVKQDAKQDGGSALWREIKGLAWVILAVLGFHSFIAKPFYIPSESMMPALLKGDRLVVSKYAYGWSFVSPTIPNPAAILRTMVLRGPAEPWGVTLPFMSGRLFGRMPERGDVVIVTPPGANEDYIKRVIGLPGDTIQVRGGRLVINGTLVRYALRPPAMIAVDANAPCGREFAGFEVASSDGAVTWVDPSRLKVMNSARPPIFSHGTGPPSPCSARVKRLSADRSRLSPIRNTCPAGTLTGA